MAISTLTAKINGQTYNLTLNQGTGEYEATITAPSKSSYNFNSGHYYPVELTATDDASNTTKIDDTDSTLGSSLQLQVKETTAPVIQITAPTEGAVIPNNKPVITFQVTDDDSGVDADTITIKIDNGSPITDFTTSIISGGYSCTCSLDSALADGNHTIEINAGDYDGNVAVPKTVTITIDTVPPSLTIDSPADHLVTNVAVLTVSGITNDTTSSPVTLTVNDTVVPVASNGEFNTTISLAEGTNVITIVATDGAGKMTTVTRTVTLDTVAPVFRAVTITPNPIDCGKTFVIRVDVADG